MTDLTANRRALSAVLFSILQFFAGNQTHNKYGAYQIRSSPAMKTLLPEVCID